MPKVCTVANIRIMHCDYEMWRMLSKGATLASWPRGAKPSWEEGYTSTIFCLNHGRIDQDTPCLWGLCGHSPLSKSCIEALSILGCNDSGLYLLYDGHGGLTSLVRRA